MKFPFMVIMFSPLQPEPLSRETWLCRLFRAESNYLSYPRSWELPHLLGQNETQNTPFFRENSSIQTTSRPILAKQKTVAHFLSKFIRIPNFPRQSGVRNFERDIVDTCFHAFCVFKGFSLSRGVFLLHEEDSKESQVLKASCTVLWTCIMMFTVTLISITGQYSVKDGTVIQC